MFNSVLLNFHESLKIDDFIVYFFLIYIIVNLLQRILKEEIKYPLFEFSPKILITVVLFYLALWLNGILVKFLPTNNPIIEVIQVGMALSILAYIFERFIFGIKKNKNDSFGLFPSLIRKGLSNLADKEIEKRIEKENVTYRLSIGSINEYVSLAMKKRKLLNAAIIDSVVCIITFSHLFSASKIHGLIWLFFCIWFMSTPVFEVKNTIKDLGQYPGQFIARESSTNRNLGSVS